MYILIVNAYIQSHQNYAEVEYLWSDIKILFILVETKAMSY